MNKFRIYLSLACVYAILIFYLSSKPSLGSGTFDFLDIEGLRNLLKPIEQSDIGFILYPLYLLSKYPDKFMHMILYAGFGFLLYFTLKNSSNTVLTHHAFVFAIFIGTIYGAGDEYHQTFVIGRSASTWDLLADGIGVALAQAIVFIKDNFISNKLKKKRIHDLDLKLAVTLIILSIIFILIPPFNQTFFRILIALPLLLFLPGYLFIAVMFPRRNELTPIERFTLSIGLSIAITVFDGFALNYTRWGYRPNSIVISLSLIMGVLLLITYLQRMKLEDAYAFSLDDIRAFYQTLKSKEESSELENMLIKTMIVAIVIVAIMLTYAYVTREPENFTALYILGKNGKAENYPEYVEIGKPTTITVGVENYEHKAVNYTLRVQLGGKILKEEEIHLKHNQKWLKNVSFIPELTSSIALTGINSQKPSRLEFILLKDNTPYRSVHLWVRTIFDINKYLPDIRIINSDMEQTIGWNFTSTNKNITGNYTNSSWVSPSHSYVINFSASKAYEYGEIYQNLTIDKKAIGVISFFVKDSSPNATSNISKQVLLDNKVVWESGVGNKSWKQIKLPVFFSKNTRLAFRVINKIKLNTTIQVWWDDIKIEPYVNTSTKPVSRPVILSNTSQLEFRIRGAPISLRGNVSINGATFPGFYYDIDENKSYEELNIVFSENHTIKAGNATYISRVHGDEISLLGARYKVINAGMLTKILMKHASKTLNLSEKWIIGNDYSLYLRLISSKGDLAMLELRKGSRVLDSKLMGRGVYQYKAKLAGATVTVFRARVDEITLNSVKLKEVELYSDEPVILKVGDTIGDFDITNVSSSKIVMKNSFPIEIQDGVLILGGSIKFRVIDDMAFPYAMSGEIHGTPHKITPGSVVNINGLNYPGFYYDFENNISTEELIMNISYNATVERGEAVYITKRHGNELNFLGKPYWLPYPERINFISRFSSRNITLPINASTDLEDGFILFLRKKQDKLEVIIRKQIPESELEKITSKFNGSWSSFFKDIYYEMYVNTKYKRFKSNMLREGEEFEYWIEDQDIFYKRFSGKILAIKNNNVTMEIREYHMPEEILTGMSFGSFEVESITNDTILLRNTQPIRLKSGKQIPILGGALKLRVSSEQPLAYPMSG